jgi:ribosome biogenesis GTPase / thiamine phosphate phosphatase
MHSTLQDLGWNEDFAYAFSRQADGLHAPGRVATQRGPVLTVLTERGPAKAQIAGRLKHRAATAADLPAVGDWVVVSERPDEGAATIHGVLPRRSTFVRKEAGVITEEQVLAANVDTVFVMTSLNADLNLRRLERYLTLSWESGATPVVVLTKSDVCDDVAGSVSAAEQVAIGVAVHAVSAVTGDGMEALAAYLERGRTVALLGSSGVGKSTLVNRLMDEEVQTVRQIRSDDKGRHTTTHRELLVVPGGGLLIDTPGMREMQLWEADDGLGDAFPDVEAFASRCRFSDCQHDSEPGCAVKEAMESGELSSLRYASYVKLQRELMYLERKRNARLAAEETRRWKVMHKSMRRNPKPGA